MNLIWLKSLKENRMTAKNTSSAHEEIVSFDKNGNININKESQSSKKLLARRAIEAHLEKKQLEQDFDSYLFDEVI